MNALLFPYLNNAVRLFDAGVATRDDIDAAMKGGCNFPMGPLELLDLVGLDTSLAILDALYAEFERPELRARAAAAPHGHRGPARTEERRRLLRLREVAPATASVPAAAVRRMGENGAVADRPWLMRTYSGHSSARASNELYRTNLAQGQTGLSVAFDLPTQTGYDPDHPLARGEVGKVGVPVPHLGEMRTLFDGIPLDEMNTSMTINATAMWLFGMYLALAEERGVDPRRSPARRRTTS